MKEETTIIADELISVVVPVYNVENYLERCVNSIIKQTYKKLDIILVNDGSTDNSGKICDKYKKKYPSLVKVIHQENRGLSEARNAGLEIARGKYITFIDSDDWISSNMINTMYKNIKMSKADISVVGFYKVYENGKIDKNTIKNRIYVMNNIDALECFLFNGYLTPCVWGKLWDISLWDEIKCPAGKLFEDQYTTYKILDKAKKIVFDTTAYYYYLKRNNSIGHMPFSKKTYDLYEGIQEEYKYITSKYPNIQSSIAVGRITWELVFANMMFMANKNDQFIIKRIRNFAKKHIVDIIKCRYIGLLRKIQILLFIYNIWLYKKIYFQYKKKRRVT